MSRSPSDWVIHRCAGTVTLQYLALFESVAYSCRELLYIRQRVLLNHLRLLEISAIKLYCVGVVGFNDRNKPSSYNRFRSSSVAWWEPKSRAIYCLKVHYGLKSKGNFLPPGRRVVFYRTDDGNVYQKIIGEVFAKGRYTVVPWDNPSDNQAHDLDSADCDSDIAAHIEKHGNAHEADDFVKAGMQADKPSNQGHLHINMKLRHVLSLA